MHINTAIGETGSPLSHDTPSSTENESCSPLIEHIDSANISAIEFNRHAHKWMPERMLDWLKDQWWHRAHQLPAADSEKADPEARKLSLKQVIARQEAESKKEARSCLAWKMGLLTLGLSASAFGAYTWLRLKNDGASNTNRTELYPRNEYLPLAVEEHPLPQALVANDALPQAATDETTTVKKLPARRRSNLLTCKGVASLERCEHLRAQHSPQKPGILLIKENDQTCRCPPAGAGVKSTVIHNEVEKPDPEERLLPGIKIKDSPSVYFRNKIPKNLSTEPPAFRRDKKAYIPTDSKQDETETEDLIDEVKIERLFDFSCIEARNNLTPVDKARAVADALVKPVTGLAKEIQIIYSHNIEGKGCPTGESVEALQAITDPVDVAINNIMTMFPGFRVPALLQNVVGPAMQMLADQYEGKEVTANRFSELNQQLIAIMRPVIPTLSTAEQVSLYNKVPAKQPPAGEIKVSSVPASIYKNRVALHNNIPQVNVEGRQYKLQTLQGEIPFVIDNDRGFNFIRYDNLHDKWVYVAGDDASIYKEDMQEEIDKYSMSLANRSEESSFIFDKDNALLTFTSPGEPDVTGVFVAGKFIPAKWENVNGRQVAVTNTPGKEERRILIYNGFGWSIERPSVKTDKYLEMLLQDPNTDIPLAIRHTQGNRIAPINNAIGYSDSAFYGKLIKQDNKYFRVTSAHDDKTNSDYNLVMGYNDAVVEYEDGMLKLKKAADIPFALRNAVEIPRPNLGVSLRVERGTLDYLTQHAQTTPAAPIYSMHNGIFKGANGELMFVFLGQQYPISKYEHHLISIPGKAEGDAPDIRLWLDGDTWVRIRDERNKTFTVYEEAATCRTARAPGDAGSCAPVMIERELHKQLTKYIDKDLTTNKPPVAENLSQSDLFDIPALFFDINTIKHYFLYNNQYFDAKVIQANDRKNPTNLPCLKITGKGNIFKSKSDIATIVIEKTDGKYFIKTQQTFLAEKLNIDKKAADEYLQNRIYRDVAEINTIEGLVNEVQQARKIFVAKPMRRSGVTDLSLPWYAKQQETVREKLFSQHVNQDTDKYDIKFFAFDADTNSLNPFEQKAVEHLKAKLKYVKEKILNQVVSATYFDELVWPGVAEYFKEVLPPNKAEKQLEADFIASLQSRLGRVQRALDEKKIFLVTAHEQTETELTDRQQSVLPEGERQTGDAAYMSEDGDGRLFINIDKIDFDGNLSGATLADPVTVIMQAATHTKGMSVDIMPSEKNRGINPPVKDYITRLISQLEDQTLPPQQRDTLIEISKEYINNVAPYRRRPGSLLSSKGLAYLLKNDPGYRAHVLLNSSEGLTTITQDMYYWINMSDNDLSTGWIDPWMKRFGVARGDLSETGLQLPVSTSHLELSNLSTNPLDYLSIHEVHGKKQIYYALPTLDLLFKSGPNYYQVEFVGTSNKIIFLGKPNEVRQMYYYDADSGNITPIQSDTPFNNAIVYNRNLDLYESHNFEKGLSSVLKYDEVKGTLIDTGAQRIVPMLNNIKKVEFKHFDLFTSGENTREVYLAAHGARQLTLKREAIPDNINLKFYTPKGKVLRGHVDDLLELVKNKLPVVEARSGGNLIEAYDISYDSDSQINYHLLAQKSGKNLIRVQPDATATSTEMMEGISKLFANKEIDLHLYICRNC